jgi:hypothetical protein
MLPLQTNIVLFNNSFPSLKPELFDSIDKQMRDAVMSENARGEEMSPGVSLFSNLITSPLCRDKLL